MEKHKVGQIFTSRCYFDNLTPDLWIIAQLWKIALHARRHIAGRKYLNSSGKVQVTTNLGWKKADHLPSCLKVWSQCIMFALLTSPRHASRSVRIVVVAFASSWRVLHGRHTAFHTLVLDLTFEEILLEK